MSGGAGEVLRWTTVLFVPADQPSMLRKAQSRGASALMIDLEDAIPPRKKDQARQALLKQLGSGALNGESRVYVRINAAEEGGVEDAAALSGAAVTGLMVPKTTVPEDLLQIRDVLGEAGALPLIPQIESAAGILGLGELLQADVDLTAVAFGGEDFAADLGVPRSRDSVELLFSRAWLALNANAAGLPAIDTVFTDFEDEGGLRQEAGLAAQLGFSGKLVIHPAQIATVEAAFAPSPEQLDWAQRVLAAMAAVEQGSGVATVDGAMVDAPVLAQAQRMVARVPGVRGAD